MPVLEAIEISSYLWLGSSLLYIKELSLFFKHESEIKSAYRGRVFSWTMDQIICTHSRFMHGSLFNFFHFVVNSKMDCFIIVLLSYVCCVIILQCFQQKTPLPFSLFCGFMVFHTHWVRHKQMIAFPKSQTLPN